MPTSDLAASQSEPSGQIVTVSSLLGSTIIDNNVALLIPPGATGQGQPDTLAVSLEPLATETAQDTGLAERILNPAIPEPRGPARLSPRGTVFRVNAADATGRPVGAFEAPVTLAIRYSSADLAGAGGDPSRLTVAYLVDADTPAMVNPDLFPVRSWVFFPPSAVTVDPAGSVITVKAQAFGGAVALLTGSGGRVRTLGAQTRLFSGADPGTAQIFGVRPPATSLLVVEPQVGDRLYVWEPATGSYAYVNAADVAAETS